MATTCDNKNIGLTPLVQIGNIRRIMAKVMNEWQNKYLLKVTMGSMSLFHKEIVVGGAFCIWLLLGRCAYRTGFLSPGSRGHATSPLGAQKHLYRNTQKNGTHKYFFVVHSVESMNNLTFE